ncbi:sigma factor-like helix-turn-helix DNA-binding protein [Aeromicrobium sp. CF4.19]|uniref:sigma factor-like helix-turn-helix DNA-binding protein n=1 Tax=Aeromicrobium sp. CF4.19 TaxID=3373082 RepID=UPI003EE533C2
MSESYRVEARRWAEGWELHIDGEGVTQVRTLDKARDQVRSYLETLHDRDVTDAVISIVPQLDGLEAEVTAARAAADAAAAAQLAAAREIRTVAFRLRTEGLSVTDMAAILGVSRGRVSQLLHGAEDRLKETLAEARKELDSARAVASERKRAADLAHQEAADAAAYLSDGSKVST